MPPAWPAAADLEIPRELPIAAYADPIAAAIVEHQVLIVCGETGSGKTTQLPKICLAAGRGRLGRIGHTQPRRIAARAVATRIRDEVGEVGAERVHHKVRFDDRTNQQTLLQVMTDGVLLAELARDPELRNYDTVILDEAHERSLNIDFLLGYLHRLLPQRPDLRLIITSATLQTEKFSRHFGDAPIFEIEGRTFPVEIRWRPLKGISSTICLALFSRRSRN